MNRVLILSLCSMARSLLLLLVVLQGAFAAAQSNLNGERRVALVVGNSSYRSSPLKNPQNDAREVSKALRNLNFEVIERENLGREAFSLAIREFGDRLKGAHVALFYFAGHGLQVKGRNYLVPVDADIAREDEVPYRSLDVNEVLDKMDSARTAINLVVLDACRNNPFARSFRLSQVGLAQMDAPQGTLISFATAPGSVAQDGEGANGLFTGALLKHISERGLAVEQMFKRVRVDVARGSNNQQVPWESSSLNRDFSFASESPRPAVAQPALAAPSATGATELALELAFWESIRSSRNPADYSAYLEQYPQGRFAALARVRAQTPSEPAVARPVVNVAAASPMASSSIATAGASAVEIALPYGTGFTAKGNADGRLTYRYPGVNDIRRVDLGTSAQVSSMAVSPEGLYLLAVSGRQLHWVDLERGVVLRRSAWNGDAQTRLVGLEFSPNGRWVLLKTITGEQTGHQLADAGSGKIVWSRPSTNASFAADQPVVHLRDAAGQLSSVSLPS